MEECAAKDADLSVLNLANKRKDILLTNDAAVYYHALALNIKAWWLTTLLLACVKSRKVTKEEAKGILHELVRNGLYISTGLFTKVEELIEG